MEGSNLRIPKRRSQADKIGKHKYTLQFLHRIEERLKRLEKMQRIIITGLEDYFHFDKPFIEEIACKNNLDLAVVTVIFEAGAAGILPKGIIEKLPIYSLERHKILRIVNRINKNVVNVFGRAIIEKSGKKWILTDFGFEVWGESAREVKEEYGPQGDRPASSEQC